MQDVGYGPDAICADLPGLIADLDHLAVWLDAAGHVAAHAAVARAADELRDVADVIAAEVDRG